MDEDLLKWLNQEFSDDELKSRLGSEEANKYIQIVNEVDAWTPDSSKRLFDPVNITSRPKAKVRNMYTTISYAVAAAIVLAVVSYMWLLLDDPTVSYSSSIGEVREIILPDGVSTVTLSSNSEISWDKNDWDKVVAAKENRLKKSANRKRKVKLKGKALFKVEKGDPFEVESETGIVEVLGTIFEVDDFEEGLSVTCYEGKVAAKPKKISKRVIISRGEGYRYFKGRWEERIEINKSLPDWIQNQTRFENAPLAQVIKTLEKLYGVTVDQSEVDIEKRFTGTIPNDKLDVSLKIIFTPYKIKYVQEGKKIILSVE